MTVSIKTIQKFAPIVSGMWEDYTIHEIADKIGKCHRTVWEIGDAIGLPRKPKGLHPKRQKPDDQVHRTTLVHRLKKRKNIPYDEWEKEMLGL